MMATEKKIRKDKEIFVELEAQIKDLKHQLNEQLRCLDQRLESQVYMSWELQEFFQRRAEVEVEYSKNLEKLVKQTMARHKAERQKREQWHGYSAYKMWQTLLGVTLKQGKSHGILAETYNTAISTKFTQLMEDMQRIYRKCREMAVMMHDELTKVVTELHSSMKTYYIYHNESQQAEQKLEKAEKEKNRIEQESKKGSQSRRFKNFEKQYGKHKTKFDESDLKALKARNDYLLCLDSANGAIRKFFVDDLPELINVMDYSYHISLGQIMIYIVEMEETVNQIKTDSLTLLSHKAKDLNQRSDRQSFLQQFHAIFSLPKKFEFQPHKGDSIYEVSLPPLVRDEMADRLKTITDRLHTLRLENDEIWKTLETTDTALLEKRTVRDIDVVSLFRHDGEQTTQQSQSQPQQKTVADTDKQNKSERVETEEFYLGKFKEHQLNSNLIARLQAKCYTIETAFGSTKNAPTGESASPPKRPLSLAFRQTKTRHLGKSSLVSQPKLFGGSIEEYVQATGQVIPPIVQCCIRLINLYGMHHQGVFRVPGSQHEINNFKNLFERGDEPLLSNVDSRDINSIAGVLKLYFRELREPLFPLQLFDELIACSSKYNVSDIDGLKKCICRIQELLLPLPRSILIVMRYLFAFLNHLSEYSDENMMDAHNLAVCFGPTLMPIQSDHDQMRSQNYVNELIRILIVHQEAIFPKDGGPVYEKCIVEDDGEDSLDSMLEDIMGPGSEDDVDCLEAVALFDYTGHSDRELSFRKGDAIALISRTSPDWWEGAISNNTGLIPHKYIAIQGRGNSDKDNYDLEEKMKMSTESLPAKSFGAVVSHPPTADPLDRSISQPNISGGPPPLASSTLASFSSASSDILKSGYDSCAESMRSFCDGDTENRTSDSGAGSSSGQSGGRLMSIGSDIVPGSSFLDMEPTPDLVLNLPFNISQDSSKPVVAPSSDAVDSSSCGSKTLPSTCLTLGHASDATSTDSDQFVGIGQNAAKKEMADMNLQSIGLPSPSRQDIKSLKFDASPDSACADDMFKSALEEIEQTLSGLAVASSLKLFGIIPVKPPELSSAQTPPSLRPSSQGSTPCDSSTSRVDGSASGLSGATAAAGVTFSASNIDAAAKSQPPVSRSEVNAPSASTKSADSVVGHLPALKKVNTEVKAKFAKPTSDDRPKPPPTMKKPAKDKSNPAQDSVNK